MFENTAQIVGSQFITIPTQDTAYKRSSFQKKIDFDVIQNALRNIQIYKFSTVFLLLM